MVSLCGCVVSHGDNILHPHCSTAHTGALFSFVSAAQVIASVLGYGVFVPVYTLSLKVEWYHRGGISFLIMGLLYGLLLLPMM